MVDVIRDLSTFVGLRHRFFALRDDDSEVLLHSEIDQQTECGCTGGTESREKAECILAI